MARVTPRFRGTVDADGTLTLDQREATERRRWLRTLAGERVEVLVRRWSSTRTSPQNRRYWALLTVAADSLWGDKSMKDALHEHVAQLLLGLPPDPRTGMPLRKRTPKLNTQEFSAYTEDVANLLAYWGADLSGWDEEERRMQDAA